MNEMGVGHPPPPWGQAASSGLGRPVTSCSRVSSIVTQKQPAPLLSGDRLIAWNFFYQGEDKGSQPPSTPLWSHEQCNLAEWTFFAIIAFHLRTFDCGHPHPLRAARD